MHHGSKAKSKKFGIQLSQVKSSRNENNKVKIYHKFFTLYKFRIYILFFKIEYLIVLYILHYSNIYY